MAKDSANTEVVIVDEVDEDGLDGVCAEYGEHRGERTTYEDDDCVQWECTVCGAEGYEDK